MNKLEEIIVNEDGVISLNGDAIADAFPILSPFYFNGQDHRNWKDEMIKKAPKNAKFYSVSTGNGVYMNGMEPCEFKKAYVQFYAQRKNN